MADQQVDISRLFAKIGQQQIIIEMQSERIQELVEKYEKEDKQK